MAPEVVRTRIETSIDRATKAVEQDLLTLRRAIHRRPELAGDEKNTAALVADRLRAAGLEVSTGVGGHGVVGILDGGGPGATIAYRADMDAVAMDEDAPYDFRSQVAGAGHLCGHDLHTAIGVGVASVLAQVRAQLPGRVVFYFQPAEESLSGAQAMIDDGALDLADPQEIYALHCAHLDVGRFAVMPGLGLPGQDGFDLELDGGDAPAQAAEITARVGRLSTVALPTTPQEHQDLLTTLQVENGPLAGFVFAGAGAAVDQDSSTTRVHGWVKAWPDAAYSGIRDQVSQLVREICGPQAVGRLRFPESRFPAMVCSPDLSHAAAEYFRTTFGPDSVATLHACLPFNGEDFALFLDRIQGAMFFLGVANPAAGLSGLVHTPTFAADERAIGLGTRAMAGWLADRLLRRTPVRSIG